MEHLCYRPVANKLKANSHFDGGAVKFARIEHILIPCGVNGNYSRKVKIAAIKRFWVPETSFPRYQNDLSHWAAADKTRPVPPSTRSFLLRPLRRPWREPQIAISGTSAARKCHRASAATRGGRWRLCPEIFQESNSNFEFPIRKTLITFERKCERLEIRRKGSCSQQWHLVLLIILLSETVEVWNPNYNCPI